MLRQLVSDRWPPAFVRPRASPWLPWLPWIGAAVYTVLLAAVVAHHEMWRDEMQAWLLARDSSSPLNLLHSMRYEGHPPLWHLLLWPFAHLSGNPAWMQALHVALAGATSFVVFRFCPFPWPIRILLIGGYFFSYEWSVIARNYAVLVLAVVTFCALYARRWSSLPLLGLALAAMALSHGIGLTMGLALGFGLVVEFAISWRQRTGAQHNVRRFALGIVVAAAGFAAAALQSKPPHDARFAKPLTLSWNSGSAEKLATAVMDGYLPLPVNKLNFWNSNQFVGHKSAHRAQPLKLPSELRVVTAAALIGFGALLLAARPLMLVPFAVGTVLQLALTHMVIFGHARHHGLLFLMLVATLWMSCSGTPAAADSIARDPASPHARTGLPGLWLRHRMWPFAALLVLHVCGASMAIGKDWNEPFSQSEQAAHWLSEKFPDPDSILFVGDRAPVASSVVGYLGIDQMYYPDRSQFGSYQIFDRRRTKQQGLSLAEEIDALMKSENKDAVLVMSHPLSKVDGFRSRAQLLRNFQPAIVSDEKYWIYFVPRRARESVR